MNTYRGISQVFKTNVLKQNQSRNDKFCSYFKKSNNTRDNCYYLNNKTGQNWNLNKSYSQMKNKNNNKKMSITEHQILIPRQQGTKKSKLGLLFLCIALHKIPNGIAGGLVT